MSLIAAVQSPLGGPYVEIPEKPHRVCSSEQKLVIQAVVQIAVRIFFVFSVIFMTAAIFPLSFSAVVLPLFGVGAAMFSAFFFHLDVSDSRRLIEPELPLLEPMEEARMHFMAPLPAPFQAQLPVRGLYRQGMNCWLNSDLQWMDCDPHVAGWLRTPIPEDLELFMQYLERYDIPEEWKVQFRNYRLHLNPPLPVSIAFEQFLHTINPGEATPPWKNFYLQFRAIYRDLLILQPYFSLFMGIYDQAAQHNLPIVNGNSQYLREVLSRLSPHIDPSPYLQMDAAEALTKILDLLPNRLKVHVREYNHYRVDGVTPMLGNPLGITEKEQYQWGFQLEINKNEPQNDLLRMFNAHCNETREVPNRNEWVTQSNIHNESQRYQPIRRRFEILEHPTALRLQIKRFESIRAPTSWLTKVVPNWWPGMGWRSEKLHNPVAIPRTFPLRRQDGQVRNYQLTAFIVHLGETPNSGHYIAYRKLMLNGAPAYFRLDDHVVTQIDPLTWERESAQAYLVDYLPE